MRTTLVLDDDLLRRAKYRAAELKLTVSDVVNQALRAALNEPAPRAVPFAMPTFGSPARMVHHEPADFGPAGDDEAAAHGPRR